MGRNSATLSLWKNSRRQLRKQIQLKGAKNICFRKVCSLKFRKKNPPEVEDVAGVVGLPVLTASCAKLIPVLTRVVPPRVVLVEPPAGGVSRLSPRPLMGGRGASEVSRWKWYLEGLYHFAAVEHHRDGGIRLLLFVVAEIADEESREEPYVGVASLPILMVRDGSTYTALVVRELPEPRRWVSDGDPERPARRQFDLLEERFSLKVAQEHHSLGFEDRLPVAKPKRVLPTNGVVVPGVDFEGESFPFGEKLVAQCLLKGNCFVCGHGIRSLCLIH